MSTCCVVTTGPGILASNSRKMLSSRLHADDQAIGLRQRWCGLAKQRERRVAELDGDLRFAHRQALAGADVEGHARPAPVVHQELHGHIGLGVRMGSTTAPAR